MVQDLTQYQKDLYLKPFWQGDTVYHEPVLFYTGRTTAKLLYPVNRVLSLRSYSLEKEFVYGRDYEITKEGLLKRLTGSRIPVYTGALTQSVETSQFGAAFAVNEEKTLSLAPIGDLIYPLHAVSVTYTHSSEWEKGKGYTPFAQRSQTHKLKNTLDKLQAGDEVNIAIFGDSISCGWSSSGLNSTGEIYDESNCEGMFKEYVLNVPPFAPIWPKQVFDKLQEAYPKATVHVKNISLGGKSTPWGVSNIVPRLKLWHKSPDLLLIGFGVNDITGGLSGDRFGENIQTIINKARELCGNSLEILLYSPMLPNTKARCFNEGKMLDYENRLCKISESDSKVGLVELTSAFSSMIKSKEAVDYLNTNINHGNDFAARMYAQGMLAAMNVNMN